MSDGASSPDRASTLIPLGDLPVAGLVRDADRRIVEWNSAATALFGWSEAEVLGVRDSERIWPPLATDGDDWAAALRRDRPTQSIRSNRHKDGGWLRCEWNDTVVPRDGRPAVLSVVRDRTERDKLEQQLRVSQRREVVGTLVGGVAHDFNNLLTAMFASIEFLDDRLRHVDLAEAMTELRQLDLAAVRAADLTRQLLMFLRNDRGRARPVNLNDVVTSVATLLRRIGGDRVSFDLRLDPALPTVAAFDGQLEQVVTNLCLNARDAMPDGGEIRITTERAAEVDAVALVVSDSGTGMTPDLQERIFEPFFTTKPSGQGTGLGLAVTAAIVDHHGGRIAVSSTPGAGSRFRVTLPSTRPSERVDETRVGPPTGTERVLVVDADAAVRRAVARALTSLGYWVEVAEPAQIPAALHPAIALVVLDRSGQSGEELYGRVRAALPSAAIVATGDAPDPERLAKPFTPNELARAVRSALDAGEPREGRPGRA